MAKESFSIQKVIGLGLIVLAIGLAYWGFQMSDSLSSKITEAVTGSPGDKVTNYYIGSAISLVVGLYLFTRK